MTDQFHIGDTLYMWWRGGLYVSATGGSSICSPLQGTWTCLEECAAEDARACAEAWESQRPK